MRRTHVWIVNHYAVAPDRAAAAGSRHFDLAKALVARGSDATVFAAGRNHLTGREERLGGLRLSRTDWFDGVRFVWLRTTPYHGNSWRRMVNMISFVLVFILIQVRIPRPQAVVGSTVHPFAALGAWLAARLRHAPFLLEIRDLWPQTLVDLGELPMGSPGERILRRVEAFLVRRAVTVIALLPGMRDYLQSQGLPTAHVVYVPNSVDVEAFGGEAGRFADALAPAALQQSLETIQRMRQEGRFVLGYTGTFGRVNRLDTLVDAIALAERSAPGAVGLIMIGDGPERGALEERAARIPGVAFGPAIPKRLVPELLGALDGTVVHATSNAVYRYGISFNKLFEYMAASRPVIFACTSAYDPVAATGAGITVPPDEPAGIAAAFLELASTDQASRTAMGVAGRRYVVEYHNLEQLGSTFASTVAAALAAGGRGSTRRG